MKVGDLVKYTMMEGVWRRKQIRIGLVVYFNSDGFPVIRDNKTGWRTAWSDLVLGQSSAEVISEIK